MNILKLQEVMSSPPAELVKTLQKSTYEVPKWADLYKQYDPSQHSIWDTIKYPAKLDDTGQDTFKRTAFPLQKLAVKRLAQAMFSTPVDRIYSYDKASEQEQSAVNILEQLYRVENSIDSENVERAKKLNATCQVVTIWKAVEKPLMINKEISKFKLTHQTYSEKEGYQIYAQYDDNNELLVVSILYKDTDGMEFMDVYLNWEKPEFRRYFKVEDWVLDTENSKPLEVFPAVHIYQEEPAWGGDVESAMVEHLEEMESYQGLYIKRNALPTFTLDYGDVSGGVKRNTEESATDARRIITLGKGGAMNDVTWEGAGEAVDKRFTRLRNAFFESVQIPDVSFANLLNSNTSAENKELLFSDSKAKARDLGGEWEKFFYQELMVVKGFCKILFPKFAAAYDNMVIRSKINPYSIRTKKENSEYVSTAGDSMSLNTKVRILGDVDDVNEEVDLINQDISAASNQMI
jgi:hypothetical protein